MPRLWPGSRSMRPSASFRRQIMEASASKRETVVCHPWGALRPGVSLPTAPKATRL